MSFSLTSSAAMDAFVFVPLVEATRRACLSLADRYSAAGLDKAAKAIRNEFTRASRYDLRTVLLTAAETASQASHAILSEDTLTFLTEITPVAENAPSGESTPTHDRTPYLLPPAQRRMLPAWGLEAFGLVCPAHWRSASSRAVSGWTLPNAEPQGEHGIPTIRYSDRAGLTFSFAGNTDLVLAKMDDPANLSRATIATWVGHMCETHALDAYATLAQVANQLGFPVTR